jgi:two-component system response regulator VicR
MTRILSLDNCAEIVDLLSLILTRAGYEHIGTTDNYEALSILHSEPIDLFTQDLMRPDLDGWTFYELMKSDASLRHIPVLIISAKSQSVDKILGLQVRQVDGYLTKPFGPQDLLEVIAEIFKRRSKPLPTEEDKARARTQREAELRRRAELLQEIVASLSNVKLEEGAAIVYGQRSQYKVALDSGSVVRWPTQQHICIASQSRLRAPRLCLPFEKADATAERIISTILMLSADQDIRDETILRQIKG